MSSIVECFAICGEQEATVFFFCTLIMAASSSYKIHVIKEGYSYMENGVMRANGTCTLITGRYNIIVDTLSPWDKNIIVTGLANVGLSCEDVHYVVCTHGHIDHVGNLNLFTRATHIVGFSISNEDSYYIHPFEAGEPYKIDDNVQVVATPGHTATDVSLVVHCNDYGTVAIVGDLFEREEDIGNPSLWCDVAGSENPTLQRQNRKRILNLADHIIPGHGKLFKVTTEMRETLDTKEEMLLVRSTPDGEAAS